ncbi:MAG: alpha/beta hydrolase [Sphingobium sp.]
MPDSSVAAELLATDQIMTRDSIHDISAADAEASNYLSLEDLTAKYVDRDSRFMTIHGVRLHYKDEGEGPAILMIHGSSSSMKTFDGSAAILRTQYRVIRYDIPGWGLSQTITNAVIGAGVKAEDFPEALLTALGVESATVTGVSSGGTTAHFLAAKRPDLVERLVLSNAPSDPIDYSGRHPSKALRAEEDVAGRQDQSGYKRRAYWDAFFEFQAGDPDRISSEVRDFYYDNNRRIPDANRNAGFALVRDNAVTRANGAKVTCPVLLLWGEQDALLPAATADTLEGYLPNASVSKLLMPDVGHYPPLEIPERYAQIVAAYIAMVTPLKPRLPFPSDR